MVTIDAHAAVARRACRGIRCWHRRLIARRHCPPPFAGVRIVRPSPFGAQHSQHARIVQLCDPCVGRLERWQAARVPTPGNIYVNLGFWAGRFSTVADRFSGSWCRFPESWGQDGENGEKMGGKRAKVGEKWPKKSGGKLT